MRFSYLLYIAVILMLAITCTHDPVIPEDVPENNPMDTTMNPVDTTGNNCDTSIVYFENDILPIFQSNCAFSPCHDAGTQQSNLDLSNYNGIMTEITPSNLQESDIYERITEDDPDKLMPRIVGQSVGQMLDDEKIRLIEKWILQGANNNRCDECDTSSISFANDILPIFVSSCNTNSNCHGTGSVRPIWDNHQIIINNLNKIQVRAIERTHSSPMPPSGPLPNCDISQLKAWINDGAQNN
ncbi:MAG: c-type cytochrome domain-containing protein [Cytophagales bacterium]